MTDQKVIRLLIRHIKGVRKIEVLAHPTLNEIAGANGAGKSSVLDAIVYAFAGKRAIDAKPLRDGAAKGEVIVETEDLTVRRTFSENGDTKLTVAAKDGRKLGQRELDSLLSRFSFDPLAFSRAPAAEQVTILQQLIGPEFAAKLTALDEQIAAAAEERRLAGRELARLGQLAEVAPAGWPDVDAIDAELESVRAFNGQQLVRRTERAKLTAEVKSNLDMIAAFERQVAELQEKVAQRRSLDKTLCARLEEMAEPEPDRDENEVLAKMRAASQQQAAALAFKAYRAKLAERAKLAAAANGFDEDVQRLRAARAELQETASLPLPGVTFGGAGLRVGGIPFEQLSSSERIRVSARIGMAASSGLRVMFIRDGSLLDAASFAEVKVLAAEMGVQLWVESVGEGHGDAIVLEAGEVAQAPISAAGAF